MLEGGIKKSVPVKCYKELRREISTYPGTFARNWSALLSNCALTLGLDLLRRSYSFLHWTLHCVAQHRLYKFQHWQVGYLSRYFRSNMINSWAFQTARAYLSRITTYLTSYLTNIFFRIRCAQIVIRSYPRSDDVKVKTYTKFKFLHHACTRFHTTSFQ